MDGPTLFDAHLFPALLGCEFEVRGDDHEMPSCLALFAVRRNEEKIYRALLKMANAAGMGHSDDTWAISVGYTALRKATGCSSRAFGRAWPRLLGWGFLVERVENHNRSCARYYIRSIESLSAKYRDLGYVYFRVMPDGNLQPFRPKPRAGQGAR
jgi:hypothetical protein